MEATPRELRIYITKDDKRHFKNWLVSLKYLKAITKIERRLDRLEKENFGDYRVLENGIFELRTSESYHDYLIERLKAPVEAQAYLQTAYEEYSEDGDMEMFWIAQNNISEASNEEIIVKNIDLIASGLKKTHSERKNTSAISE